MANKTLICLVAALFLGSAVSFAQNKEKMKDLAEEATKAAETLNEIMGIPEKAIPKEVLAEAECVAVFPSTIKGGFIIGAQKGEGVISCRTAQGWSAPAFLDMSGGSVGAQIGGQKTDYVLLIMNREGADKLLANKLTLGGEVSATAGPVGREAGASTDWKLNAQILSYSRSKGLFAGATLQGVAISIDNSDMKDAYGAGVSAHDVIRENKVTAPAAVRVFPETIARHSTSDVGKK